MRNSILALAVMTSLASAATSIEPVSGLPIFPGAVIDSADGIKSKVFCKKSVRIVAYYANGSSESADENAWYTKAMPNARVFKSSLDTEVRTFFTPDGTASVSTHGYVIQFSRYSPGLTEAEMKLDAGVDGAPDCE